jgi:hypothetical protein
MKNFKGMFLVFLLAGGIFAEDLVNVPEADSEPANKKTTKEETGILSSMISWYSQVRNAVKFAYDEVQYFKGVRNTWIDMQNWWKDSKARVQYLKKSVVEFPLDEGSIFMKLEKTEEIFDQVDDLAFRKTAVFDSIASTLEFYVDTLIENPYIDAKGRAHRVLFAPTTDKIAAKLTQWSEKVPWQSVGKTEAYQRKKELADYSPNPDKAYEIEIEKENVYNKITHQAQDEQIIEISKEVAAHVLSNSKMYEQWAVQASRNAAGLEEKFKNADVKGLNATELQTAWWMLEQMNSTNKQIAHSEMELKAYVAALGIDIYETTEKRSAQIIQNVSAKELGRSGIY